MMRLLVVEDERRLAALLARGLGEAAHEVRVCHTGTQALQVASAEAFDVLILDVMLPGLSGLQVAQALRERGITAPILMLTALDEITERVAGLDAGADDYLAKPFAFDELLARLRALHRRGGHSQKSEFAAGDLRVDTEARRVRRGQQEVELSAREFDVLALLIARAGQCVSRYDILDEVWDGNSDLRSNVIDVHIAGLRSKIDKPFGRHSIETLRGAGYRLAADGG
jgi:two-component system OmpR family response regulator